MGNVGNDFFKTKRPRLGLSNPDQPPLQPAPPMLGDNASARQESQSFILRPLAGPQARIPDRLMPAPYDPPKRVFQRRAVVAGEALLVKRQHGQRRFLALDSIFHWAASL